jgi:hypothetical protein
LEPEREPEQEREQEREPAVAVTADAEKRPAPSVRPMIRPVSPVSPASSVRRWAVAAGAAVLLVGLGVATRQPTVPNPPAATEPSPRSSAQPVVAQPRTSFPELAYDPTTGRLWGVAEDVELDELLQDIGELAAIRVESRIVLSERVTQRFNGDTLEIGLRGLLAGFETAFRHEVDAKGVERLRAVRVLGRREQHEGREQHVGREADERSEPGGELDRVLRELVDDPVNAELDATIRVLAASGPRPEAFEFFTDLGARRATEGHAVQLAHARLRSAMCRAWAGSPEASAELEILRCRKPPRAGP